METTDGCQLRRAEQSVQAERMRETETEKLIKKKVRQGTSYLVGSIIDNCAGYSSHL
jgi:uncharacterized protein YdaT